MITLPEYAAAFAELSENEPSHVERAFRMYRDKGMIFSSYSVGRAAVYPAHELAKVAIFYQLAKFGFEGEALISIGKILDKSGGFKAVFDGIRNGEQWVLTYGKGPVEGLVGGCRIASDTYDRPDILKPVIEMTVDFTRIVVPLLQILKPNFLD